MNAAIKFNVRCLPALALILGGLIAPSAWAQQPADAWRTITVNGTGEVSVSPDMARVNMAVIEHAATTTAAQQQTVQVTNAVLKLLDKLGIDRKQVNTTGASVRPDYNWNRQTEKQELQGYIAERRIEVEVNDLDTLPQLIEGAITAGVNQVSPPMLDTTKRREAYRQALTEATMDARANAESLARSLGVKMGNVLSINTGGSTPPPMPMMRAAAMSDSMESAGGSYNAGDIKFNADVTVSFQID